MKNKFFLLAGLPGSGKSYLAGRLIEEYGGESKALWLSSDKIREELYGAEEIQGDSQKVFQLMYERTAAALKEEKTVIYDACNINAKRRKAILTNIKKFSCEKICIVCAVPYEECQKRNEQRERVVPYEVIERMYLTWSPPHYEEGWDKIELLFSPGSKNSKGKPEDFADSLMEYEQDNPHHGETLGKHLWLAHDYLLNRGYCKSGDNLLIAALLHDCGKPYTKGFFDAKGNKTEIAHYYQHGPAGAYDAMFFDYGEKSIEDILEILFLIGMHMYPFSWQAAGNLKKQEKRYGKEIYDKIMMLHEADEAASIKTTEENNI